MSASAAQLDIAEYRRMPAGDGLDMRVSRFVTDHPETLRALVWLAREKVAADRREGREPLVGVKGLIERLRWRDFPVHAPTYVHTAVSCNNSYASRIARIIAARHEDLATVFEFRELTVGEREVA